MFRTTAIAVVATFVGGAASPVGSYLRDIGRGASSAPAVHVRPAPRPHRVPGRGLRLTRADDGLFHAPVLVNGHPLSLIVDTGATVTVLSGADAARLGVAASGGDTPLRTAGGTSAMRWARVRTLRIAGHDLADLDIAIVDTGLDHSLLGQDVLGAAGVLRVEREHMEIS